MEKCLHSRKRRLVISKVCELDGSIEFGNERQTKRDEMKINSQVSVCVKCDGFT